MSEWINRYLFGTAVPCLLVACGIFFYGKLRGFPFRYPKKVWESFFGRHSREERASSRRALRLALAGTLGVGNLVGVSAAIAMGGAGAVFWMWLSAFFAMVLKYAEIVLALRHRRGDRFGVMHGSAMCYIQDGLTERGFPRLGRWVSAVFALLCLANALSMGSMIQVHAVSEAMTGVFRIPATVTGCVLGAACALIVRRGSEGILRFSDRLVPVMTAGYLILSAAVLVLRRERIVSAFAQIFTDALTPNSAVGGVSGFLLSRSLRFGSMRGLISNEAGVGTAPMAHATAKTAFPARQGLMGILEVWVDTMVLCTVTALVVLVGLEEGAWSGDNFMMMTISAYTAVLGEFSACFMAVAVLCFGFATVICWAHYGAESVSFLSKKTGWRRLFACVYVASVAVGAVFRSSQIWQAADLAVGAMTLINVVMLWLMNREVREETDRFLELFRA